MTNTFSKMDVLKATAQNMTIIRSKIAMGKPLASWEQNYISAASGDKHAKAAAEQN